MPILQVVATVSDEDKHSEDVESVIIHNDKIYTGANEGRCRVRVLLRGNWVFVGIFFVTKNLLM